jgi:hypothetical protein
MMVNDPKSTADSVIVSHRWPPAHQHKRYLPPGDVMKAVPQFTRPAPFATVTVLPFVVAFVDPLPTINATPASENRGSTALWFTPV